ncbi:ATPase, T2SS/T4P/T4SS family [Bacillus pumilus]|uniref:ATPase, T2SS/T4P/T4SS family n=1 Tax=Bacillus pumilus TaxID=1408 RepID=UPI0011A5C49F|nr:ATPase, T2SS/T4P/T4SS family [Bacillus pumilus]
MSVNTKVKISKETIFEIEEFLIENYPAIYNQAFENPNEKDALRGLVEEYLKSSIPDEDLTEDMDFIMSELVGLGIIDELRKNPDVTDIGYDGTQLWVKGNGFKKYRMDLSQIDAQRIMAKVLSLTKRELTLQNDTVNTSYDRMRINMVHDSVAVDGETFAIRMSKIGLALNQDNFDKFAPSIILEFLEAIALTRSNILISGETGTGKTEFQKLFMSLIDDSKRINFIETNKDMHAKETFPKKDLFYWIAQSNEKIAHLIQTASLRSDVDWLKVAEVVGAEVYQMYQAMLTGHRISSTLHAFDAWAQFPRLLGMVKEKHSVDDKTFLDNLYRYIDFGFHLEEAEFEDGTTQRFLAEIVAYHSDHTITTVFKREFDGKDFIDTFNALPDEFTKKLKRYRSSFKGFEYLGEVG